MILITDKNALEKMILVESEQYRKQGPKSDSEYSLDAVKSQWETCNAFYYVDASIETPMEIEEMKDFLNRPIPERCVIYGLGGWNRYFCLGSGEVVFSRYHSTQVAQDKAEEAGFRLW